MDREIVFINQILLLSKKPLTTSEIAKQLFDKYELRLSRTIVKNYLWSYFRSLIEYDSADFTYALKADNFLLSDVDVEFVESANRAFELKVVGSKFIILIDTRLEIELIAKGLAILNFRSGVNKSNIDLLKQLNRILEQLLE